MIINAKALKRALEACAKVHPKGEVWVKSAGPTRGVIAARSPEDTRVEIEVEFLTDGRNGPVGWAVVVPIPEMKKAIGSAKGNVELRGSNGKSINVISNIGEMRVQGTTGEEWNHRWFLDHLESRTACVEVALLAEAIVACGVASSTDPTRYNLHGVHVKGDTVCATDGHRLHYEKLDGLDLAEVLLPAAAVGALSKLVASPTLWGMREGAVTVIGDAPGMSWSLVFNPVDARFPDYQQVIPAETLPVARSCDPYSMTGWPDKDKQHSTKWTFNGEVRATATAVDTSFTRTFAWEPLCEWMIGVSAKYMAEGLAFVGVGAALDAGVTRGKDGAEPPRRCELSPVVLRGGRRTAVIMPMRV